MRVGIAVIKLLCVVIMMLIAQCNVVSEDGPALSELTMGVSRTYVAYSSPDRSLRPDTFSCTFKYNLAKSGTIKARITLDTQKTWIEIDSISLRADNIGQLNWVPSKLASSHKDFFGRKQCRVQIFGSNQNASEYLLSDTFTLIGSKPFIAIAPLGGETFTANETVNVLYSRNNDLTANISICFSTTCSDLLAPTCSWEQTYGENLETSKNLPIKNYKLSFVPSELAAERELIKYSEPLIILFADYGTGGKRIYSGPITIK